MRKSKLLPLLFILFIGGAAQAQSIKQVQEILEQFCRENYDDFFRPCQYKAGSLKVTNITPEGGLIKVEGIHSYRGRHFPLAGRLFPYPDRKFYAEMWHHGQGYKVKFWRLKKYYLQIPHITDPKWEGPYEGFVLPY